MPYVTPATYVARYGARETGLLTNESALTPGQVPEPDTAKVEGALATAEEVVESYVGKRYVTPIVSPPRLITGWVMTLAREDLHVTAGRVPKDIVDAADRVRQQLRDVSRGDLTLPIDAGQPAPVETGGSQGIARSSNDRPSPTFGGVLDELTAPFLGSGVACWRR